QARGVHDAFPRRIADPRPPVQRLGGGGHRHPREQRHISEFARTSTLHRLTSTWRRFSRTPHRRPSRCSIGFNSFGDRAASSGDPGRSGARALLVDRFGSLGGTGTAAMMNLFYVPYAASRGLVRELLDRLVARGGAIPGEFVVYDPELYKVTALEMLREVRAGILLHTLVSDVIMDGRRL